MRRMLLTSALVFAAVPLLAQEQSRAERFMRNCDNYDSDRERFCVVRDVTLWAFTVPVSRFAL